MACAGQVSPTTGPVVAPRSRPSSKEADRPGALVGAPAADGWASRSPAASIVGTRRGVEATVAADPDGSVEVGEDVTVGASAAAEPGVAEEPGGAAALVGG